MSRADVKISMLYCSFKVKRAQLVPFINGQARSDEIKNKTLGKIVSAVTVAFVDCLNACLFINV